MYINKIDDLIDKVIEDFSHVLSKDKTIKRIVNESNFVKFQKEINNILQGYIETVPRAKIEEVVKKTDSINSIYNAIKKYVTIYLLLYIGYNYKYAENMFINNMVEFTKNQSNYKFKIDDFFNSKSTSDLVDNYYIIKNIVGLVEKTIKLDVVQRSTQGKETIKFLSELVGDEFIKKYFMIDNTAERTHNIIKTLIILLIYKVNDKKTFFDLLEMSENEDGEFMFIDIVRPTEQYMSYEMISSLIKKDEEDTESIDLIDDVWDYMKDIEKESRDVDKSFESNILKIINKGILVPIVDDFMLYHKESERYEDNRSITEKKKKEDTRIRYIISKIEAISELYSENTKDNPKKIAEIKKSFYTPFHNRKAITHNVFENIKIINKFINQGKRNAENTEYFNDLINYISYPYINFKSFRDSGISIMADKTINAVRAVSFVKKGDFRQNPVNTLQTRVFSKGMTMNIVGFMVPGNCKHYKCYKVRDVIDIRNVKDCQQGDKYCNNGVKLLKRFIRKYVINTKNKKELRSHNKSAYWLFNMKSDKANKSTYESSTSGQKSDIKNMLSNIYDDITNEVYFKILDKIEKVGKVTIQQSINIINSAQRQYVDIKDKKNMIDDLEKLVYTEYLDTTDETYDRNEDKLYGLEGKVTELGIVDIERTDMVPMLIIDLEKLDETGQDATVDDIGGVCQHNITWEDIAKKKRKDPKSYSEDIYNFITKYVFETPTKDYVCKSCGMQLNIKKYVSDGTFDNDTKRFITYSVPMEIPLEEVPEYAKFRGSIRIMDKNVEKISSIINLSYLVGPTSTIKYKRRDIVRATIDMVGHNYKYLDYKHKERGQKAHRAYGTSGQLSSFFIFELSNDIFQYSSEDKDKFRSLKWNTVIAYTIINMILDMNKSQVKFLSTDRKYLCDFDYFEKLSRYLFGNLKVLTDNKGGTTRLLNKKVLCYTLYLISCKLAKQHAQQNNKDPLWKIDDDIRALSSVKKMTMIQNHIINTVIDILNAIMENSFTKNAHFELEIFRTRFLEKMNDDFCNEDVYKSLKGTSNEVHGKTIDANVTSKLIPAKYDEYKVYEPEDRWIQCKQQPVILPPKKPLVEPYDNINTFTNCDNGDFHNWKSGKGTFTCQNCQVNMESLISIKLDNSENYKLIKNYLVKNLQGASNVFCKSDGLPHIFAYDSKKGGNVCQKCKKESDHKYTKDELFELDDIIKKNAHRRIEKSYKNSLKTIAKEKINIEYVKKVVDKTQKHMKENTTREFSYVYSLVKDMEKIIGNDKNILKNSKLFENTYVINHNHEGFALEKPIVISDSDKKISTKKNHSFFKTDVIYYVNYSGRKVEVFYDSITKILIGHKEESREYVRYTKSDAKLKINYSIFNKLILMGYKSQYIDIKDVYEDIFDKYAVISGTKEGKDLMYKNVIVEIIRDRHNGLRKVLSDFYRTANIIVTDSESEHSRKILFNEESIEESTYYSDRIEHIINKYIKKIGSMFISEKSGKGRLMKHWKAIVAGVNINTDQLDNVNIDFSNDLLDTKIISSYDNEGNILLYYLIEQMKNLLNYNNNKFTKINIIMFMIDFINNEYNLFNMDDLNNNKEIRRFMYVLKAHEYARDVMEKDQSCISGMTSDSDCDSDDEIDDEIKEKMLDDVEADDADYHQMEGDDYDVEEYEV